MYIKLLIKDIYLGVPALNLSITYPCYDVSDFGIYPYIRNLRYKMIYSLNA